MVSSIKCNLAELFSILKNDENNLYKNTIYFKFSNNKLHIWLEHKLEDKDINYSSFLISDPHISLNCTLNNAENIINLELFTTNYPIYIPFEIVDQDIETDVIYKINMTEYSLIDKLLKL